MTDAFTPPPVEPETEVVEPVVEPVAETRVASVPDPVESTDPPVSLPEDNPPPVDSAPLDGAPEESMGEETMGASSLTASTKDFYTAFGAFATNSAGAPTVQKWQYNTSIFGKGGF